MNRSAWPALFVFLALLPFVAGCAGGCGEDGSKSSSQDAGGPAMASGQQAGGGTSNLKGSRYDTGGKSTGTALGQLGEVSEQLSSPIKTVKPSDFPQRVLHSGATVFLTIVRPDCPDCDIAAPVLESLAQEFSGKLEFMRYDGSAMGASGRLPPKIGLEPLPAFVMYKNGKATSWLQGMPFERQVDAAGKNTESVDDYRARLMRWFHDALEARNLFFSRTLKKGEAKKT